MSSDDAFTPAASRVRHHSITMYTFNPLYFLLVKSCLKSSTVVVRGHFIVRDLQFINTTVVFITEVV